MIFDAIIMTSIIADITGNITRFCTEVNTMNPITEVKKKTHKCWSIIDGACMSWVGRCTVPRISCRLAGKLMSLGTSGVDRGGPSLLTSALLTTDAYLTA